MKLSRPDLVAYGVVIVCVVGIVLLTALRVPVPDFLTFAGTTALGIGGGVALQGTQTAQPSALEVAPPSAGPLSTLRNPAPVPLTSEPATGVFRAVTHAP